MIHFLCWELFPPKAVRPRNVFVQRELRTITSNANMDYNASENQISVSDTQSF